MDSAALCICALCGRRVAMTREEIMYEATEVSLLCQSCFQLALKMTAYQAGRPRGIRPPNRQSA